MKAFNSTAKYNDNKHHKFAVTHANILPFYKTKAQQDLIDFDIQSQKELRDKLYKKIDSGQSLELRKNSRFLSQCTFRDREQKSFRKNSNPR